VTQRGKKFTVCPIFNFELKEESAQEFQISDKIRLRRIKKDELAKMKKLPFSYFLGESYALLNWQTFVFEIESDSFDESERLVYKVLLAMRLFKTGSVFCKHFWIEENSGIRQFFSINPPLPWAKSNYLLTINEIEEIKGLLEKIIQIELEKNTSFRVACERFSRSFEERRYDDKIIDLAIAFESLFTDKNTSRSNVMGQFIGLGCSMLIGKNREERNEIKQFFIKAFDIRNKIVHGLEVKIPIMINKKEYMMRDISSQLQEFLGASIKKLI